MKKLLYWLLACAVGVTLTVEGIYVYKFGSIHHPTLSSQMSEWGQFGDYISGTLGTYFGFLAFIGVLFTVLLQHQQLEHMRAQSKIEEIQRVISTTASRINDLLVAKPSTMPAEMAEFVSRENHEIAVRDLIAAGGHSALGRSAMNSENQQHVDRMLERFRIAMSREMDQLGIELSQLAKALMIYKDVGGSTEVEGLYRERFAPIVCWIDAMGLLNNVPLAQQYFDPKHLRQVMTPAPR